MGLTLKTPFPLSRARLRGRVTLMDIGLCKRKLEEVDELKEEGETSAHQQLIHASSRVPKSARTRAANTFFTGPTTRHGKASQCMIIFLSLLQAQIHNWK